jgi:hypothetical protein
MTAYCTQPAERKPSENHAARPMTSRPASHGLWSNFLNTTLATLRVNAEQYRLKRIDNLDDRMLTDMGVETDALDGDMQSASAQRALVPYWAPSALQ